jgi:hypothetical protein
VSPLKAIDPVEHFHIYLYGPSCDAIAVRAHDDSNNRGERASVTEPFRTSFEQAMEALERIPGISFEPDGSFGFVANAGKEQLFGMLYDAGDRLQYVDLQGTLTLDHWRTIVLAICGSRQELATLTVLKLPDRTLKTFQQFEKENWSLI